MYTPIGPSSCSLTVAILLNGLAPDVLGFECHDSHHDDDSAATGPRAEYVSGS